ncbi:MAG: hypothetical protein IPF75_10075 [Bacteroidetes bacterium]|nr:hypothetical protein [Bacteroidota bacterium]
MFLPILAIAGNPPVVFKNNLDGVRDSVNWINESTRTFDSQTNNHFSRVDTQIYAIGYKGSFPENVLGSNIYVEVKVKFRNLKLPDAGGLAFSVQRNDSTMIWDSKDLESNNGDWKTNKVPFFLPSNFVDSANTLLIYCWTKDKTVTCDFDDVEISIGLLPYKTTVIPYGEDDSEKTFLNPVRLQGSKYIVEIDSMAKKIRLLSNSGDTIISSPKVIMETYRKTKADWSSADTVLENASSISFNVASELVKVKIGFKSDEADADLELLINNLSGDISIDSKIVFNKNISVKRIALFLQYGIPVRSVINENSDLIFYKSRDYWIKNGQIVFETKGYDLITDKNGQRSSLELIGERLIVNLDFARDHPLNYFPLKRKNENFYNDVSEKIYLKGSTLSGQIKLLAIDSDRPLIRLMNNPDGIPASMVWTEHADFSDIRTQRAVMFGSEEIVSADSAISGFVGHGIPVTKSVFYDNPTKETNSIKDQRFNSPSISVKHSPEFLEMLKQLKKKNFEICLHTPDPYTTNRKLAEEAMSFMKENFASVNWIDHGYDNSPKSNREDINCDGLDSTSKYYMSDLFKKYGVKYNWSSYYEDNGTFANTSFNSFFTNPYSGWNDPYAAREYFRNPKNESLISWRTTYTLDPPDGSLWNYYFDDARLNDLVQSKGNCILHCYLARVDSTTGFYSYKNGKIVINPDFDKVLAKLKRYMDENKIWLTTVEKLLDYRLQLENVKMQYLKNNQVVIYNANVDTVKGLSVVTKSANISAGEKNIRLKKVGEETIAIFDLAPKEKLILDLR